VLAINKAFYESLLLINQKSFIGNSTNLLFILIILSFNFNTDNGG